jgi:hypothetical protein
MKLSAQKTSRLHEKRLCDHTQQTEKRSEFVLVLCFTNNVLQEAGDPRTVYTAPPLQATQSSSLGFREKIAK